MAHVLNFSGLSDRWRRLLGQFGIRRDELEAFGLQEARVLRLPRSVMAASIAINTLGLALPLSIMQVYDRVIPHSSGETLLALLSALIVVVIVDGALKIARAYMSAWVAARFTQVSMVSAFERVLYAPRAAFTADPPARHLQRLQAVQRLGDFYGGRSRLLLLDLPFVFLFLAVLALIGGWLVLVALAVVAAFAIATVHIGRKLRAAHESRDRQDAKIHDFLADALTGITTLKGHAMEPMLLRRFERLQRSAAEIDYEAIELAILSEAKVTALGNVTMIAMVTVGAVLAIAGDMTIGTLSACTMLSGRAIQPILGAASLWNEVQKMRLGLDHVRELFALPEREHAIEAASEPRAAPAVRILGLGHRIEDRTILEAGDIELPAGAITAFTGDDESGKATLLHLIAGEGRPTRGEIHIDGEEPGLYRTRHPGAIGIVAQNPVFFRGTILDNLTLFGDGPTADEARNAAAFVGVDRDIARLPSGYDMRLGEGVSETLPTGFLKRLAFARALALRPGLLLLDEPQAFLDQDADRQLLAALERLRGAVTIVMCTNRPSYLAMADRAWLCRGARITPLGGRAGARSDAAPSFAELMRGFGTAGAGAAGRAATAATEGATP